jgi:hypothetical protein
MSEPKLQDGYYWHFADDREPEICRKEGVFWLYDANLSPVLNAPKGRLVGPLVPPSAIAAQPEPVFHRCPQCLRLLREKEYCPFHPPENKANLTESWSFSQGVTAHPHDWRGVAEEG